MGKTSNAAAKTEVLSAASDADVERAAALLREGKLVAMPTETVYGLAANAMDERAVAGVFAAKGRPGWDPLIVHVSDRAMLDRVVREIYADAVVLMDAFWPGPLTLLLPRHADLPVAVTAGRDLVGVRMPLHATALGLIRAAGLPLAAPSANRFGHISPTTAEHVLADLAGSIEAVLDAGPCAIGVESTVLDPAGMILYRQGGVSAADIERVVGRPVTVYAPPQAQQAPEGLPSPGVGIRHYAPHARLVLVSSQREMQALLQTQYAGDAGVMRPADWALVWAGPTFAWARFDDPAALARDLYQGLRTLDAAGVRTILCPLPAASGQTLVEALRDRLHKAARPA